MLGSTESAEIGQTRVSRGLVAKSGGHEMWRSHGSPDHVFVDAAQMIDEFLVLVL